MSCSKVFTRSKANILVDPNEPGLIAGYNMKPVNGNIIDVSGNGATAINNTGGFSAVKDSFGLGIESRRASGKRYDISGTTPSGSLFTLASWVRPNIGLWQGISQMATPNVSLEIITGGQVRVNCSACTPSYIVSVQYLKDKQIAHVGATYDGSDIRIYINGVLDSTTGITGYTSTNTMNYLMSSNGSVRNLDGTMYTFAQYETVKDADWFLKEYNKGKRALFHTDYGANLSSAAVTSGQLENTPFQVKSGSFKISADTIEGEAVKVIECVTSGSIYIDTAYLDQTETEAAYGTWEFWIKKEQNCNFNLYFVSSDLSRTTSYNFRYNTSNIFYLRKITASLISTSPTTFTADTWHKIKITRKTDSKIELFANDVSVGTVTDTSYGISKGIVIDSYNTWNLAYSDKRGEHSIVKRITT